MNGFPSSLSEPTTHADSEGKDRIERGVVSSAACDDWVDKRLEFLHVQEEQAQYGLLYPSPLKYDQYLRWHAGLSDNNHL
ncbi:MAG: hypothetical protein H0U76_23830 [Ktedonobacteraceae bacterium]|nr:hypothetical protein [Ktedonobacteraceae bacterium]